MMHYRTIGVVLLLAAIAPCWRGLKVVVADYQQNLSIKTVDG